MKTLAASVLAFIAFAASAEEWLLAEVALKGRAVEARFATEDEAHAAAAARYLPAAISMKREVFWWVVRTSDGGFTYTSPSVSEPEAETIKPVTRWSNLDYVSGGHVHWEEVHKFSGLDANFVDRYGYTLYLASPDGLLKKLTPHHLHIAWHDGGRRINPPPAQVAGEVVAPIGH